jgi:membrane protein
MFERLAVAYRTTFNLFAISFRGWNRADASMHAAAIAYAALFSLAPLVVLIFGAVRSFMSTQRLLNLISTTIPGPVGMALRQLAEQVIDNQEPISANPWVVAITLLMLAFGASRLFLQLRHSLNWMYSLARKPQHFGRNTLNNVLDRIFGAVLVIAVGLGFVLIIMASLGLGIFGGGQGTGDVRSPLSLSSLAVSYVVNAVIFALLFKYVPQATVRWRDVLPGALVTALLYFVGNVGVGIYFVFSHSVLRYGAASFVLVLLFWVYIVSLIVLFGAKFTEEYAALRGAPVKPDKVMELVPDRTLAPTS